MDIIVTGASGYIGSLLCEKLLVLGENVIGIDMIPSSNHHQNYNHVLMDLSSHEIKIDPSIQVKRIYHLAALRY